MRRLEKIEKEMGYCDIKLEKERRLRTQAQYLQAEAEALERFLKLHESSVSGLQALPYAKIAQQLALEKARMDKVGPIFHRAKEDFVAAGVLELMMDELDIIRREKDALAAKLAGFTGFLKKRSILEEERDVALKGMPPAASTKLRKLAEEFTRVEDQWNSMTEDALNLDEAIFFLARNVDYMRSSRSFLVSAKGSFDIESWIESRFTTDLFRHSNVGRAKEMIEGANRNLKMAQKELCGVANLKVQLEGFEKILVQFLDSLFEDIFLDGRLGRSISFVEAALLKSEKNLAQVRQKRETLHSKLEKIERSRMLIFQRMGGERRGSVSAQ